MKRLIAFVLSFGLVAGLVTLNTSMASAEDPGGDAVAEDSTAEVDEDGTKFDPAIDKSKVPAGAWYCDMGDVHYAQMNEGDGECAVCGMKLTQKDGDSDDHGHGHEHGHEGHHH
jgi:hypothetical protein